MSPTQSCQRPDRQGGRRDLDQGEPPIDTPRELLARGPRWSGFCTVSLSAFIDELERCLKSQTLSISAGDRDGLRVLEATDVRGLRFRAMFIAGMNRRRLSFARLARLAVSA